MREQVAVVGGKGALRGKVRGNSCIDTKRAKSSMKKGIEGKDRCGLRHIFLRTGGGELEIY